ncbi:MAG: adenylyltransferase/cytidyltransferase family protein [Micromonosporaceae bacterium]
MRLLHPDEQLPSETGSAVTIGNFDGPHRGHIWLLRKLRQAADSQDLRTALVTFDPHPLQVLRPVAAPKMLTDTAQRIQRLAVTGLVDICQVLPFDQERSRQSPEQFVEEELVDRLQIRALMVGANFRFGHRRSGDIATLRRLGERHGFTVTALPLLTAGLSTPPRTCCSTYLRLLVAEGQVERAAMYLERPHEVSGRVVATSRPGPGRGTPIVVVRVPASRAVPTEGSYFGSIQAVDGRERAAGISVRPGTVTGQDPLLDLHVTDMVQDLMDHTVIVSFRRRTWSSSPSELLQQVNEHDAVAGDASAAGGWGSMI